MYILKKINKLEKRYDTIGDYYRDLEGHDIVTTIDTGNDIYNDLVLIHELVERVMTKHKGITIEQIDNHDLMFEKERKEGLHSEFEEPGNDFRAPYIKEHKLATKIELMIARHLGVDIEEYEKTLNKIF